MGLHDALDAMNTGHAGAFWFDPSLAVHHPQSLLPRPDRLLPSFRLYAKMEHIHYHPGGEVSKIHYWKNLQTGRGYGFKFK